MTFLDKLFRRREKQRTDKLQILAQRLDAFLRPSLSLVDSRTLTIPENRDRYALFIYGAVTCLAEREELDETQALAVLVRFLASSSRLNDHEVSRLVSICASSSESEENRPAVSAGAQAMGDWLKGETRTAVSALSQLLSS